MLHRARAPARLYGGQAVLSRSEYEGWVEQTGERFKRDDMYAAIRWVARRARDAFGRIRWTMTAANDEVSNAVLSPCPAPIMLWVLIRVHLSKAMLTRRFQTTKARSHG